MKAFKIAIAFVVLALVAGAIYICQSKGRIPFITLYRMEDSYHEYGYWNSMIDAMMGQAPAKTMKVPLVQCLDKKDKLCYAYNPTNVEFAMFLAKCVADTSKMCMRGLYESVEHETIKEEN